MRTIEHDPLLEQGFSHRFNQSSVKELTRTGVGDCFAYAKFKLYSEPWLSLFVKYDNGSGIHFGVVEATNGLVLHHLVSNVRTNPLYVDESVEELVNGGQKLVEVTQGNDGKYDLTRSNERVSAVFYNTYEWSDIFRKLHENIDVNKPWSSTVSALNDAATDII